MKMTKRIVAIILATLTVFAAFSFTACVGGAKGVAKNYCNFMKDYKYEKLVDLLPAGYIKEWLDENDMTKSELVKALKSLGEDAKEEAEDEDYKITKMEVYNEKDMKNSEVKDLKEQYDIVAIPPTDDIMLRAAQLPDFHRDPADRIIIATSLASDLTVVTGDGKFPQYGVRTIC